jgi:7-cyano-7-deazaguanine synthase
MKVVVVLSGGLDSTVVLYDAVLRNSTEAVKAISFNYGQRHVRELVSAREVTEKLGVVHKIIDLTSLTELLGASSLVNPTIDVPEGHYTDMSMKSTVVPNRNMILLSVAAAWAISERFDAVAYGAHAGDHTIYPDCRDQFVESFAQTLKLADWHQVEVLRPFVKRTKGEIVLRGVELGVPFENTWSCYKGEQFHCGKCGTCVERREAFVEAGVIDPTRYSST